MTEEPSERKIEQYLLDELSEPEREEIEERLFADDNFFLEVQATEMGLIDRYVRKAVSAEERIKIEEKYLVTPERRKRVAEAATFHGELEGLRAHAPTASEEKKSWFERLFGDPGFSLPAMQYAAAGLIAVMALGMGWLVYDGWKMRQELQLAQNAQREMEATLNDQLARKERELSEKLAEQDSDEAETLSALESEIEKLRQQLEEARRRPSANTTAPPQRIPTIATVILAGARGGNIASPISLDKGTKILNLQIPVGESKSSVFDITITRDSAVVLKAGNLKPRATKAGKILSVSIPTRHLSDGRYDALIQNKAGEEMTGSFVVTKK